MEDISRDLEREIAKARPKPLERSKKQHILIIDSDGKIRPGDYLRFFNRLLLFLAGGVFVAGIVVYCLYHNLQARNVQIVQELDNLGTTYQDLLHEQENLMARLVLMKKDLAAKASFQQKKKNNILPEPKPESKKEAAPRPEKEVSPEVASLTEDKEELPPEKNAPAVFVTGSVVVQKFSIQKNDASGKLLVRFNIRNMSRDGKDVSGRIFTVIKSKTENPQDWLVFPKTVLEKGIPASPLRGQSFSISRFKPVSFICATEQPIDHFSEAVVFVFDRKGLLMTKSVFEINHSNIKETGSDLEKEQPDDSQPQEKRLDIESE